MIKQDRRRSNPFVITKAVDLTDEQIQTLWVDVVSQPDAMAELARPASPMPTIILGGKGSGKTHLMRYHSYELQVLRYRGSNLNVRSGIERDGYIGMYLRCSGLNAGRFSGKRQPEERWRQVFAYYIELWLAQSLLRVAGDLKIGIDDGDEEDLCVEILQLFDRVPEGEFRTLKAVAALLATLQKDLDYRANNCVVTGKLDPEILVTAGKLIFGVPRLLSQRYRFLKDAMFVYAIDEYENLSESQQRFINTLVRERELPATLRIGGKLYGIKTWGTDSADEEILLDSEYELLPLDERYRANKAKYREFANALIRKRLAASLETSVLLDGVAPAGDLGRIFETSNTAWDSPELYEIFFGRPSSQRAHFQSLRTRLIENGYAEGKGKVDIEDLIQRLAVPSYPLLEKLNLLLLYQDWSGGKNITQSSYAISLLCKTFVEGNRKRGGRYVGTLDHFKGDLVAQILRENSRKQDYYGLENFVAMSAGLPRGLLTILKYVMDWSTFNGEEPFSSFRISRDAQHRGVKDASDWFYENMRKAGNDGFLVQAAIDRLANVFRINRFSPKPIECSLITFSLDENSVSLEARRILKLAESRSFLIRVPGGQRERNSERITMKFQLNNMLAPRWDLPLGRRGAIPLKPYEVDAIFDHSKTSEFQQVLDEWAERTGVSAPSKRKSAGDDPRQESLF